MTTEPNQQPPNRPPSRAIVRNDNGNGSLNAASLSPNSIAEPIVVSSPYTWSDRGSGAPIRPIYSIGLIVAMVTLTIGLFTSSSVVGLVLLILGTAGALILSLKLLWPWLQSYWEDLTNSRDQVMFLSIVGLSLGFLGVLKLVGLDRQLANWYAQSNWDAVGALGEVFGALGQIMIAVLATYVAWRQYVISKDLTIQQNMITQQQTIDSYFQGVSELVLDDEGLLEDWPQERAIAEGRTAAILASIDALGKAKVLRFLSRARLLSPLKRDQRLGRPILDGTGGYAEDRMHGVRVIDLGVMLAGAIMARTDLRWTDLSDANLIRADLSDCELVKTNLARSILVSANLTNSDINGARLFYGKADVATPRSRIEPPDYRTGIHTGAVVENADFTNVEDMSEEQRYYVCAWGGAKTRGTVPGGCDGIPNKLGR
jgi:uncharacterized protein YjbI with pentapeptide repeats